MVEPDQTTEEQNELEEAKNFQTTELFNPFRGDSAQHASDQNFNNYASSHNLDLPLTSKQSGRNSPKPDSQGERGVPSSKDSKDSSQILKELERRRKKEISNSSSYFDQPSQAYGKPKKSHGHYFTNNSSTITLLGASLPPAVK